MDNSGVRRRYQSSDQHAQIATPAQRSAAIRHVRLILPCRASQ